ncbi:MAG TPA: hypothetical protein VG452_03365 [Egibacteraceae bacterium]|nr:hypothetical protein [Egibacteraceae bacterium]
MTGKGALQTTAFLVLMALAGVVLWGTALFAVAQYAEDLCFDDLEERVGYGAYTTETDLWPPSYECRLLGNDVEPVVVQHRGLAVARLGAVIGPPVAYALFGWLAITHWVRRRRVIAARSPKTR